MGFFSRLLGAANRVDNARENAEDALFRDRRHDRAEDLAAGGAVVEGTVTGIHFKHTNDSSEGFYRVEWPSPAGPRAAGVRFPGVVPTVLRYGGTVPLRIDGDKAVVDQAAGQTGLSLRKVPERGVTDRALNADVLRGLKKWPRETAVVAATEPSTFMGMGSQNWHVTLTLADGTRAVVSKAFVPAYVRWFVHPGATVPVAVDPGDRSRAFVDWAALALASPGGSWRDAPPPGSLAR